MGQTIYPLALGFLAGMAVQWLTKSDAQVEAEKDSGSVEADPVDAPDGTATEVSA